MREGARETFHDVYKAGSLDRGRDGRWRVPPRAPVALPEQASVDRKRPCDFGTLGSDRVRAPQLVVAWSYSPQAIGEPLVDLDSVARGLVKEMSTVELMNKY